MVDQQQPGMGVYTPPPDTGIDPAALTPGSAQEVWGAAAANNWANSTTPRIMDESNMAWSTFFPANDTDYAMPIPAANAKYGLNLDPKMNGGMVRNSFAQSMAAKQVNEQMNNMIIQAGHMNPAQNFGLGALQGALDPINLGTYALMSVLTDGAASTVSPTASLRWLGRFVPGLGGVTDAAVSSTAYQTLMKTATNPFLMGAVEQGGSQAILSDLNYLHNQRFDPTKNDLSNEIGSVMLAGLLGAGLHGMGVLGGKLSRKLPIRDDINFAKGQHDMMQGIDPNTGEAVNREQILNDLTDSRHEVEQHVLNMDNGPVEPIHMQEPESQAHTTVLEKDLLHNLDDPAAAKQSIMGHFDTLTQQVSKLAELRGLPVTDALQNLPDMQQLTHEIVVNLHSLNEILDKDHQINIGDFFDSKKGVFKPSTFDTLGQRIGDLNTMVTSQLSDGDKIANLHSTHTDLSAQLKEAQMRLKTAQSRGYKTEADWAQKVAELTPQLNHVNQLLNGMGEAADSSSLSLQDYIHMLGDKVSPALGDYFKANPEAGTDPMYRVKRNIIDKVMSRLTDTQKALQSLDYTDLQKTRFPSADEAYTALKSYLKDNASATPEDINTEFLRQVKEQLDGLRNMGVFDEATLSRLDNIENQFKQSVEKTEGTKKGSIVAQQCALWKGA